MPTVTVVLRNVPGNEAAVGLSGTHKRVKSVTTAPNPR